MRVNPDELAVQRGNTTNGHIRAVEDTDIEFAPSLPSVVQHYSATAEAFAAAEINIPDPMIGGTDARLMPVASTTVYYGEGGSGKTTLTIDLGVHLAAGADWLGFQIPVPVRVMLLENEGPIDEYRLKIRRKLESWDGPDLGGRLLIHEAPWGRVDLRKDAAVDGLAEQLALREIDVLIAGPVRRLGLEGGGTPAETVAYMQLLERVREASGRPVAIVNVHHENKGGDISGAFEAEFDTVIHVKPFYKDGTQIVFRKCRWSSKIHRARMTLRWVVTTEGFAVTESDLDVTSPAAARNAEEMSAFDWICEYVAEHPGLPRGKVENAFHDAHDKHGRSLARRVIDTQVAFAADLEKHHETEGDRRMLKGFATGPGESPRGTYLYPFAHADSPLAAPPNGETGESLATPDAETLFADPPPPIEEAADGEWVDGGTDDEAPDMDELDALRATT